MLEAAGTELRRAHQFRSDEFDGRWSHGDATTTNVIYDRETGRARFIDFEIVHDRSLPAKSRHADDLLVYMLDVIAIASTRQWLPFALSFLNAYGDPIVIAELTHHLAIPGGIAWIWWGVRTSFSNPGKVNSGSSGFEMLPLIWDTTEHLQPNAPARAKGDALQSTAR